MYIKIKNNNIVEYPYSLQQLKIEYPKTSFPTNAHLDTILLASFNIYKVEETPKPIYDPFKFKIIEQTPVFNGKAYTQQWEIEPLNSEDINNLFNNIKAEFIIKTQSKLDEFARSRGYDNILSACSYYSSAIDKFSKEANYCIEHRDLTWTKLYQIFADIENSTRNIPNSYEEIYSELPPLIWPE